ncbi:hypothetical protein HELRODRAFT_175389 [Helobdella robusta]|uniref:Sema domain-containing protein n=1 Tax=Helobdella robusta TaxID=6412 RepID=T1F982_HELRO|nr:hypothetical protein HELRODRAFT_175389 [Helobdella robusta]ESO00893.1 hypothetical protein HELRODRAFT_175389 [Helobdella robusta]
MAARQVFANEVLYFLSNNFDLFDNDNFIANTSDFYTNEDFISALKTLKTELETQNLDKLDKLVGRGNTKKEKLLDCVSILKYLKNNSVLEKCSLFASVNLAKVPNLDNIIKVNFKNLKNEIKEMLYAQQVKIVNAIDMHGIEISTLNNKINHLASKRDNYNFASHSIGAKIVGAKKNDNNKLSADKKLIKKSVFAMSNIKKCSRSNVIDYLSEVGIQVISCYPVLKRSMVPSGTLPRNEDEDSTMLRVCINASDTSKIQDPDNLPENVIIREWRPNKQGGGVGIFLREGINYSVLDEVTLSNCVVDYLGIEIKLNNAEPSGISVQDGKRPDGCTLTPWRAGKCLAWDVTVPGTLAERYVHLTSKECCFAAIRASDEKIKKYEHALPSLDFLPICIEVLGPMDPNTSKFIKTLCKMICVRSDLNTELNVYSNHHQHHHHHQQHQYHGGPKNPYFRHISLDRKNESVIYVGGVDFLHRLDALDISRHPTASLNLTAYDESFFLSNRQEHCSHVGIKQAYKCLNHVRNIVSLDNGRLYVCSSGSASPVLYLLNTFKYGMNINSFKILLWVSFQSCFMPKVIEFGVVFCLNYDIQIARSKYEN